MDKRWKSSHLVRGSLVLVIAVLAAWLLGALPLLQHINYLVQDRLAALGSPPESRNQVVIIGVDDATLDAFPEPMVLWHKYLARVIEAAASAKARAVGVDLIPGISLDSIDPSFDKQLVKALLKAKAAGVPVVMGFDAGEAGMLPHRKFQMAAAGLGFLNVWPDRDGIIRSYHLSEPSGSTRIESLAAALLSRIGHPVDPLQQPYIDYRRAAPPVISMAEVHRRFLDDDQAWLAERLGGKLLLIGVASRKLHDHHTAPPTLATNGESWIYGAMIHGLTAETLLADEPIRPLPASYLQALVLLLATGSGLLFLTLSPARASLLSLLLLAAAGAGIYLGFADNLLIPAAPLLTAIAVPGMMAGLFQYFDEHRRFWLLQRYFQSYVNTDVMHDIIDTETTLVLGGTKVVATVMFTDIRDFTTLSEHLPPEQVVAALNRYFEAMTRAVTESGGYLNRYLGDGILAIFGAPNPLPEQGAPAALEAAFRMKRELAELNRQGLIAGVNEIRIGIGIHTGVAIVGNIGCAEKMDYSIIGDTVNLASRIEGKTKEFGTPILISESTWRRVRDRCEATSVGSVKVKGRDQPVELYHVTSIKTGG